MSAIQNPRNESARPGLSKSKIQNGLRVLCLNYEYPPIGGGGGRIAHRINTALVQRGHRVRVQTAGMRHLPNYELVDGVEVFRAPSFRKKEDTCTVPEMGLYLLTSFVPALRQIWKWKPDIIHAHFAVPTGALAWMASLFTGTPYVLTAHLGDVPGGVPEQTAGLFRLIEPFTRPIWKRAAALTAVSTFVAELAEQAYGRRPEVVLNGIPLGPRPEIEVHHPPRLLMVGRLSVQKNPILALRALALVRDLPWEFQVIGDGPFRKELEREVETADLAGRVRFSGWLDSQQVHAEMQRSDVLVLTSHSEGLPMAAIEALDQGLAILSTRIGGVTDVVEEGINGVLSEANPEAVAAALRALLANPSLLGSMRAASSARSIRFDLRPSIDAYESIFQRVRRPSAG